MKSTFTVLFIIQKGKPKADGRVPIMARITINGKMSHFSTKFDILPERWLPKECKTLGQTPDEKIINKSLDDLMVLVKGRYNEMVRIGETLTADKLKNSVMGLDTNATRLLEYFDTYNNDYAQTVGKTSTQKTYSRYLLTRNRLAEFMREKYRVNDILLKDLTLRFIKEFDIWLKTKCALENNSATKFVQRFRTVYNQARAEGLVSTDPFINHKLHFEAVDRGYLTQGEINSMLERKFDSQRLELVRDMFAFSCYTGLSYIDVSGLTTDHIQHDNAGNLWVMTKRQKTKVPINIRLLEIPRRIIEKYAGTGKGDKLFPMPSNQKINDYLKEVAALCGINKRVTFHLSRHSFATTVTLGNGVPIETVSKMLGHTNIRTTQIYARITNQKLSQDMDALARKIDGMAVNI